MTITTTVPAAPDLPDKTEQDQSTFDTRMSAWWTYMKQNFEPDVNDVIDEMNTTASDVNNDASAADISESNASASETNANAAAQTSLGAAAEAEATAQSVAQTVSDAAAAAANATVYAAGTTYSAGDVVLDPGDDYKLYTSQQGSNTGNTPNTDDGTWWAETIDLLSVRTIALSKNSIDTAFTMPSGYNGMSVGPLDIDATIIINENSTWEIL